MSKNISLNIDVNVNELIGQIGTLGKRQSYNDRYFDDNNGRWISCQDNGVLYSM